VLLDLDQSKNRTTLNSKKVRINLTKTICFLQIQLVFHQLVFAVLLIAAEALGKRRRVQ